MILITPQIRVLSRGTASNRESLGQTVSHEESRSATSSSKNSYLSKNALVSIASDSQDFSEKQKAERITETLLSDEYGRPFYLGPSSTASFLSQANSNINQLKGKVCDRNVQINAESSLSDLSNALAAVNFDESANVRTNVRDFRRNNEIFFIPENDEGTMMIQSKSTSHKNSNVQC